MDTTYVTIMLVVFLVVTGLAIDIGYMYVSEEDLRGATETAALAGAESIKQRMLAELRTPSGKLTVTSSDPVQSAARTAAMEAVSGKQSAVALMELSNNNVNAFTENNDITVGFWNVSSHSYSQGANPVNAIQVRTKRTAESASVGLGSLGSFLAKITGTESFGSTPVAIAGLPAGTSSNIALCQPACEPACTYPNVCPLAERRMTPAGGQSGFGADHYLYTSLLHPASITNPMRDLVCEEMPHQEVCGQPIYTSSGNGNDILRDIKAMMYDPKVDSSNKEFDKDGKVIGWWTVMPMVDCAGAKTGELFDRRSVTRYSLVHVTRVCATGATGCGKDEQGLAIPAWACGGDQGIYIDRISCVGCNTKARVNFPGLHPVLVGQ